MNLKNIKERIVSFLFNEAGGSGSQITNSNLKNFIIKHVGWSSESDDYSSAENDLSEVKSAIGTDSYLKVALDKTAQLVMKSGYKFESDNENALEYIKQRIALMEFGTKIPFDILLEEIARNLVYYSNCFVVKGRADKIQGGLQAKPVLGKKPVGGYFIMDPTAVEIKRDSSGAVTNYKLTGTEEKEFNADDVIHFYVDRDANNNFGTPRVVSTLEDIKILRKIEGNTLSLIYRFSIPLYQMKIGLPETNFMATDTEIKEAQKQINKMPMDGVIVTNERTQFLAVGAEGKAIDLSTYLEYYEKRVFTGLNVSEAMMGRGGSKQDADSMEGLMHDTVKHYQLAMRSFIEQQMFNEILLEGGFNPILEETDRVYFRFNEINLDSRVKYENHLLNQFQSNCITFEEMRQAIGRDSDSVDEGRLYTNMIMTPSQIEVIQAKTAAAATTGNGNVSNGKTKSNKANGAAKNADSPKNQHGTTSAKIKEGEEEWHAAAQKNPPAKNPLARNLAERNAVNNPDEEVKRKQRMISFRLQYANLYKIYTNMRNDIVSKGKYTPKLRDKHSKELAKEFDSILETNSRLGYKKSQLYGSQIDPVPETIDIPKELITARDEHIKHLLDSLEKKIGESGDSSIIDCFDFMEYRLRFFTDYAANKAFNYAQIQGYKTQGVKKVKLALSDRHKDKDETIDTDSFNIDQIPPFTPYCRCEIINPEA